MVTTFVFFFNILFLFIMVKMIIFDNKSCFFSNLSVPIGVPGGKVGSMFTPIPVEVICYEPEIVGINLCQKTIGSKEKTVEPMQDLAQVAEANNKLRSML